MSDMIERVAKAIYDAQRTKDAPAWPFDRPAFRKTAKAAIDAMRNSPDPGCDGGLGSDRSRRPDDAIADDTTINWNK